MIKLIKMFICLVILYPLYFISFFIPRKNNLWVFGSHNNTFSDNSKYFFYHVNEFFPEINSVWISGDDRVIKLLRESRYLAEPRWSVKGIWLTIRANVFIYSAYPSDINFFTSGGAIKFNLWHGIPLKKIQNDINDGKLKKTFNSSLTPFLRIVNPSFFKRPDFILSSSEAVNKIFSSAFRVDIKNCLQFGYPRCDHFFLSADEVTKIIMEKSPTLISMLRKMKNYRTVFIYMPTFRENGSNNVTEVLNLAKLNELMEDNDSLFIIKLHPNLDFDLNITYSNIQVMKSSEDVYLLLPFCDVLITDYSSVFFDYMLLNRRIIFYAYDIDHYMRDERGFYFDYEELAKKIGSLATNQDELFAALFKNDNKADSEKILKYFWNSYNGNSSDAIAKFLIKYLKVSNKDKNQAI